MNKIDPVKELEKAINKNFKGQKRIEFRNLIEYKSLFIPKDTLMFIPISPNRKILFKKSEEDREKRFWNTLSLPIILTSLAKNNIVTESYISWFFSREFIGEYFSKIAVGSSQPRISHKDILNIKVPIPKINSIQQNLPESQFVKTDESERFRRLLNNYYHDFQFNFNNERYSICAIIAGAIIEIILYRLLLDNDVDENLLEKDNNLGLGKLINYVRLLKLDEKYEVPLSSIIEVQKLRNRSVHAGLLLKRNFDSKKVAITSGDLLCFDKIIKHFGI